MPNYSRTDYEVAAELFNRSEAHLQAMRAELAQSLASVHAAEIAYRYAEQELRQCEAKPGIPAYTQLCPHEGCRTEPGTLHTATCGSIGIWPGWIALHAADQAAARS
jgi:hypothetical protein